MSDLIEKSVVKNDMFYIDLYENSAKKLHKIDNFTIKKKTF